MSRDHTQSRGTWHGLHSTCSDVPHSAIRQWPVASWPFLTHAPFETTVTGRGERLSPATYTRTVAFYFYESTQQGAIIFVKALALNPCPTSHSKRQKADIPRQRRQSLYGPRTSSRPPAAALANHVTLAASLRSLYLDEMFSSKRAFASFLRLRAGASFEGEFLWQTRACLRASIMKATQVERVTRLGVVATGFSRCNVTRVGRRN